VGAGIRVGGKASVMAGLGVAWTGVAVGSNAREAASVGSGWVAKWTCVAAGSVVGTARETNAQAGRIARRIPINRIRCFFETMMIWI